MLLLLLPLQGLAQRTKASLACKPAGKELVYDCLIRLEPPLADVQVSVGADMPSMPMAHNVRPVKARPGKIPGEYRARLALEMHGEWAVKLRLSGAVRDLLIVHHDFTESGTAPRK